MFYDDPMFYGNRIKCQFSNQTVWKVFEIIWSYMGGAILRILQMALPSTLLSVSTWGLCKENKTAGIKSGGLHLVESVVCSWKGRQGKLLEGSEPWQGLWVGVYNCGCLKYRAQRAGLAANFGLGHVQVAGFWGGRLKRLQRGGSCLLLQLEEAPGRHPAITGRKNVEVAARYCCSRQSQN